VQLGGPEQLDVGVGEVRALEDLGQPAQEGELRRVARDDDVEQAVGEVGVGRERHAAAEHPGVACRHRVAADRLGAPPSAVNVRSTAFHAASVRSAE
jgi:hypothetical protein